MNVNPHVNTLLSNVSTSLLSNFTVKVIFHELHATLYWTSETWQETLLEKLHALYLPNEQQ